MKPTFSARTRLRPALEMLATFSPSSQISPDVGRSRQPIRFTNVDLPDPEGPMIASHSPDSTCRETLSSARMTSPASARAGYRRLTLFNLIISLASQDTSRGKALEKSYGRDRSQEGNNDAPCQNHRKDPQSRRHGRRKVYPANPCRSPYA